MNFDDYMAKPDKTVKKHYEELLEVLESLQRQRYVKSGRLYELIRYACIHHDDGKVNREFQKRVKEKKKRLKFNSEREVPHNVLSGYFLNPDEIKKEDYYRVLHAVLYHHDFGDAITIMKEKRELIENLLEEFPTYPIGHRAINKAAQMVNDRDAVKIKGFLHKCDYSASGDYVAEYPNDFLVDSLENMKEKWRKDNPVSDWNDLQKFCMQKRDDNIIVIAQTGMGKTEAGLQWIGNSKGYFVLPLRTAINAIYDRVRTDVLQNKKLDTRISILHSESLGYYTEQLEEKEFDLFEYESRGKKFSLPLNIATMDQLFDFIFRYQGFELKLTTFSYSKIVIDEIQMYDPELLAYLIFGLKWISDMGGKIAIMTATLSPFVRQLLTGEIPFEERNIRTFVDDSIRHNIAVLDAQINAEDVVAKYKENEEKGRSNKILVVCNTIGKAQEIYELLEALMKEPEKCPIHILHSRFVRKDRRRLEEEILEFGRTYDENSELDKRAGIWISTSLVEASLDIDFDYLFTELQDLNSLFQRLGRCNRKGKKDVSECNCYIYTQIKQDLLRGCHAFIDETLHELSKRAIQTVKGKLSETKKLELLNTYLTMENLRSSQYYRSYKKAWELVAGITPYKFEKKEAQLRNILSEDVIPSPVYKVHKEEIHEWERCLAEGQMGYVERMKVRANILQYSVNIPYWQWVKYKTAVQKGEAEYFPEIVLGKRERIQVVECLYDELGYRRVDYKKIVRSPMIL